LGKRRASYETLQADGVEDYCEMVLANSEYPDGFPQDFDLEYIPETKILIVEYALPAREHLPRLKEIKYIKSKDEFTEVFLSESEMNKLYCALSFGGPFFCFLKLFFQRSSCGLARFSRLLLFALPMLLGSVSILKCALLFATCC
jgi:hypothetical protein